MRRRAGVRAPLTRTTAPAVAPPRIARWRPRPPPRRAPTPCAGATPSAGSPRATTSGCAARKINHIPYGVLHTGAVLRVPGHPRRHRRAAPSPPPRPPPSHPRPRLAATSTGHPHGARGRIASGIAARYHSSVRILTRVNHRSRHAVLLRRYPAPDPAAPSPAHRPSPPPAPPPPPPPRAAPLAPVQLTRGAREPVGGEPDRPLGAASTASIAIWCARSAGRSRATTPPRSRRSAPAACYR